MGVIPNSAHLYVAALTALLEIASINPRHQRDYWFGLLLANLMNNIQKQLESKKRLLPPR
jgi:hypothetical protein